MYVCIYLVYYLYYLCCTCVRSTEIPVLWVGVDPEGQWIKSIELEQSDSTWQYVLKHERNAVTQIKVRCSVSACARARVCVCVCLCVCVSLCVCACVCACVTMCVYI